MIDLRSDINMAVLSAMFYKTINRPDGAIVVKPSKISEIRFGKIVVDDKLYHRIIKAGDLIELTIHNEKDNDITCTDKYLRRKNMPQVYTRCDNILMDLLRNSNTQINAFGIDNVLEFTLKVTAIRNLVYNVYKDYGSYYIKVNPW